MIPDIKLEIEHMILFRQHDYIPYIARNTAPSLHHCFKVSDRLYIYKFLSRTFHRAAPSYNIMYLTYLIKI